MTDAQSQKALGADRYVASLREAIDASLAALGDPLALEEVATRIVSGETAAKSHTKN